jgi:hypothetical protein
MGGGSTFPQRGWRGRRDVAVHQPMHSGGEFERVARRHVPYGNGKDTVR